MIKGISVILIGLSLTAVAEESIDCENPISTVDYDYCRALELEMAQKELDKYLSAAYEHNSEDTTLTETIKTAQKSWETYREDHCTSLYVKYREGSIRNIIAMSCETELTKKRTFDIWENFLSYMDSSPSVLPKPSIE